MRSRSLSQLSSYFRQEKTLKTGVSEIIPHIDLPEETFIHVEPASLPANVLQRKGCFISERLNTKHARNPGSRAHLRILLPGRVPPSQNEEQMQHSSPSLSLLSAQFHSFNQKGSK